MADLPFAAGPALPCMVRGSIPASRKRQVNASSTRHFRGIPQGLEVAAMAELPVMNQAHRLGLGLGGHVTCGGVPLARRLSERARLALGLGRQLEPGISPDPI